jgi:tryptophan-rich sensory protein
MNATIRILVAIISTFGTGLVVLYVAGPNALSWYASLSKPALSPATWSFLPIFIACFSLMSLALAVCWSSDRSHSPHDGWMRFYFILLLFSVVWIFLFFTLHALLIAFVDALFCAFIAGSLIAGAWEVDRRASYLLAPVFCLVLYLAFVNLNIWFIS